MYRYLSPIRGMPDWSIELGIILYIHVILVFFYIVYHIQLIDCIFGLSV